MVLAHAPRDPAAHSSLRSAYASLAPDDESKKQSRSDAFAAFEEEIERGVIATSKAGGTIRAARDELARAVAPTRIEIDPMVGHTAGDDHLLLSRTVLVGERGYRQGLLIDRTKLVQWLNDQVIARSRLARVFRLQFGEGGESYGDGLASDSYRYRHHFGEPFDALSATLSIAPLTDGASTSMIYALSALLAVVAAGGLLAVYRMISVRVRYAERRSAFVSAVSHELKTPLTAIRMYGEMLRDGLVLSEDKRQEYYRTIHDESERLGRLINNVLEFSQLERGQRELKLIVGSIGDVVNEVVSNLSPHAEREGFTLTARIEDDLPTVRFDRDALVQVLFNLADNAMKYARGGGPQVIEIACQRADERGKRDPEGQRVILEVRDFGPGVPRRHLSHLFEPFYRAEAKGEVAKGTGIGLALVRDLCEAMGAAVAASNVPEGGFHVLVDFPVSEARA
jgi:signal transduction histidine kinase